MVREMARSKLHANRISRNPRFVRSVTRRVRMFPRKGRNTIPDEDNFAWERKFRKFLDQGEFGSKKFRAGNTSRRFVYEIAIVPDQGKNFLEINEFAINRQSLFLTLYRLPFASRSAVSFAAHIISFVISRLLDFSINANDQFLSSKRFFRGQSFTRNDRTSTRGINVYGRGTLSTPGERVGSFIYLAIRDAYLLELSVTFD